MSLPLLIPGFGVAWGFLAVFTTGMIDRAVFVAAPGIQGSVAGNLVWYAVLSAGLNVLACYIGMCRSMLLVLSVRRRFHKMRCFHVGTDILIVLFL
ncbi:MAG: hypothetical protein KGI33_04975 [Thaumarchaeota archaeon]|nr:hypothetical protein [Nitrososphaerota archaeon]